MYYLKFQLMLQTSEKKIIFSFTNGKFFHPYYYLNKVRTPVSSLNGAQE